MTIPVGFVAGLIVGLLIGIILGVIFFADDAGAAEAAVVAGKAWCWSSCDG